MLVGDDRSCVAFLTPTPWATPDPFVPRLFLRLPAWEPTANAEYWIAKVERNRRRDVATNAALAEAGWTALRFWAHASPQEVAHVIGGAVVKARAAHG